MTHGSVPAGDATGDGAESWDALRPVRRDEHVSAETVGQDFALHDSRTGRVHFLNQSAAAIWDLLDGSRSVGEIARELSAQFAEDEAQVRTGVQAVLERFHSEGLLRIPRESSS